MLVIDLGLDSRLRGNDKLVSLIINLLRLNSSYVNGSMILKSGGSMITHDRLADYC